MNFPGAPSSFQVSFLQCGYFLLFAINQLIQVHVFIQLLVRLEHQAGFSVSLQCEAAISSVKARSGNAVWFHLSIWMLSLRLVVKQQMNFLLCVRTVHGFLPQ